MRACFKTWATETTVYEKDVIEASLAHAKTKLDSAYHRGNVSGQAPAADGGLGRLPGR